MAGRYSRDKPYVSNVNVKVRSQTREKRKQIGHTEQIGATFFFFLECNAKSNLLYIIFSAPACRKPITMVRYPYLPFRVPGRIMWRTFLGTMSSGPLYSWKTHFSVLLCGAYSRGIALAWLRRSFTGLGQTGSSHFQICRIPRCALDSKFTAEV